MEKELSEHEKDLLYLFRVNMNDIIKIVKSLEDSGVLIDGVTKAVKDKIKNKKVDFLELF